MNTNQFRHRLLLKAKDIDCGYVIAKIDNLQFTGDYYFAYGNFPLNKISKIIINGEEVPITKYKTLEPGSYEIIIYYKNLYSCEDMFRQFGVYGDRVSYAMTINVSNLNTSHSLSFKHMFGGYIDKIEGLEHLNTSRVKDMSNVIDAVSNFDADLTSWNTSNVTTLQEFWTYYVGSILDPCEILVKGWNVSNVKDTSKFLFGTHIQTLDLSGWDLSNVENMSRMFNNRFLTTLIMDGPVNQNANVQDLFGSNTKEGVFYYNPEHDYSNIISQLPSTWRSEPIK